MDTRDWLELCCDALGVPGDLPDDERRKAAEVALLQATDQPVDILGMGAAEAAIDLVVRYGAAGELNEVMLSWEQADTLPPGLVTLGDEGVLRATICAKKLLQDVVIWTEQTAAEAEPD